MRILITGAGGLVGACLAESLHPDHEVLGTVRQLGNDGHFKQALLDFTDPAAVNELMNEFNPDVVVHSGAMSKPDDCHRQPGLARLVNVEGTRFLLEAAAGLALPPHFIFLSTDFIFSGDAGPYTEEDEPGPVNLYGQTKLEAEALVKNYPGNRAIARTVLVYGRPPGGRRSNFLFWVYDNLKAGNPIKVYTDQWRTPTRVEDLAAGLGAIIENRAAGVFHLSGNEMMRTWDMALAMADFHGLDTRLMSPVTEHEFVPLARRPLKTGFVTRKAALELGWKPTAFLRGLEELGI